MASTECSICFEGFNRSTRKRVDCPYCASTESGMSFCRSCVQTYLLQDDVVDARCPNTACRLGWSEDFLSETMSKTFLLGCYKSHREKVLLDMEKARLPETQEDALRYKKALAYLEGIKPTIKDIQTRMHELPEYGDRENLHTAYMEMTKAHGYSHQETKEAYQRFSEAASTFHVVSRPLRCQLAKIHNSTEYKLHAHHKSSHGRPPPVRGAAGGRGSTGTESSNTWTFVMKCPADSCEGFVGKNFKCGLCEVQVCKECRETLAATEGHVCDADKLASVKALAKEAKPCPKCAALISKIDGCDQMWCTQCNTAFSWRTGTIETSRVHNPHYFEWLRRNGSTAPAPPAATLNAECLQPHEVIDQVIHYNRQDAHVLGWARIIRHYNWDIRGLQHDIQSKEGDEWRRVMRVERLAGILTDAQWSIKLQRGEKEIHRKRRVLQVLELFIQAGTDILRRFLPADADKPALLEELKKLRGYCNDQMTVIQSRYKNEVPYIMIPDRLPVP